MTNPKAANATTNGDNFGSVIPAATNPASRLTPIAEHDREHQHGSDPEAVP
jgi:hypothetical protein